MSRSVDGQTRLLLGKAPRVDSYKGHTCAAGGCDKPTRALSRFCTRHASQFYRTRDPNGRMPLRSELAPWRARALFALDAYNLAAHPAIIAAEQTLEAMIGRPGAVPEKYAKHWRRLCEGGATGRGMLLTILTVYGWRYIGLPGSVGKDDAVFFCALGSRFLRTVPLGWKTTASGRVDQVRLPGFTAEVVGRALADKVGALALMFWERDEREHQRRALEKLTVREALEKYPL